MRSKSGLLHRSSPARLASKKLSTADLKRAQCALLPTGSAEPSSVNSRPVRLLASAKTTSSTRQSPRSWSQRKRESLSARPFSSPGMCIAATSRSVSRHSSCSASLIPASSDDMVPCLFAMLRAVVLSVLHSTRRSRQPKRRAQLSMPTSPVWNSRKFELLIGAHSSGSYVWMNL